MICLPFLKIIHCQGIFFDSLTKHPNFTSHLVKLQVRPAHFSDLPDKPATKRV
jgi:hypothetical protein